MQTTRASRLGLFVVCACFFMTTLDMTIVNVALPKITTSLSAPLDEVTWVINAYLLIYAALSIPSGRLGDIIGQRTIFITGLCLFTAASALCGFSQSVFLLVGARVLQGIGSAFITATSLALLTSVVLPERRGTAMGIYASMAALASVIGPIVGGGIVSSLGWEWIFFVNVPIGILLFIGALMGIPNVKIERKHRFDVVGIALSTLGLFGIIFSLVEGPTVHWGTLAGFLSIPVILIVSVILLVAFVFWERVQQEPFLPLGFFKNWTFSSMSMVNTILAFAHFGVVFLLTLYFESALGMSAFAAGLGILPEMLAILIVSPLAGRLSDKIGGKYVLIGGLLCFALGIGLFSLLSSTTASTITFIAPLIIAGIGVGCSVGTVMGEAMRGVEGPMLGTASGVISTSRLVGGSIGVAVITSFLQSQLFSATNSQLPATLQQVSSNQQPTFASYLNALVQNEPIAHFSLPTSLQHLAYQLYTTSFITALRPTLNLVAILLVVGALLAISVRARKKEVRATQPAKESTEVSSSPQSAT